MSIMQLRFVLVGALALVACKDVSPQGAAGASVGVQSATKTTAPTSPQQVRPGTVAPTRVKPGAPSGPSGEETGKLDGLTAAHNQVRNDVGVAPLVWSNDMGKWAGAWASQLAANGCQLQHRPAGDDNYGENIYWSSNASTAAAVVAQWAAEKSQYHHASNTCDATCGHFTQVVWKTTTKLGCGMASCAGGGEIWVCNYDPQGNVMGQSPY